jgi:dipeptidyl aminopeptidase/acylaminoacyl peptidase
MRAEDKRLVVFETGHNAAANRAGVLREVLAWLDRYLGPVNC